VTFPKAGPIFIPVAVIRQATTPITTAGKMMDTRNAARLSTTARASRLVATESRKIDRPRVGSARWDEGSFLGLNDAKIIFAPTARRRKKATL